MHPSEAALPWKLLLCKLWVPLPALSQYICAVAMHAPAGIWLCQLQEFAICYGSDSHIVHAFCSCRCLAQLALLGLALALVLRAHLWWLAMLFGAGMTAVAAAEAVSQPAASYEVRLQHGIGLT